MDSGLLWTANDRYGNEIYLTHERWQHIIEPTNHPDMADYMAELREVIRRGTRRQELLNPQKYRYLCPFDGLSDDNTHIVAVVLFRFREDSHGRPTPNNYIVTAYQQELG